MFGYFLPIPDAESLSFCLYALRLVVCEKQFKGNSALVDAEEGVDEVGGQQQTGLCALRDQRPAKRVGECSRSGSGVSSGRTPSCTRQKSDRPTTLQVSPPSVEPGT